jgi:predicted esterase
LPHLRITRTARYETLGADHGSVSEVWFVVHGYGQLAADFIRPFEALNDGSRLIVAPEALNRFYLVAVDVPAAERPVGATWMTREDRENEIADYVAYLDALSTQLLAAVRQSATHVRVTLLGFSQGTATAARWLAQGGIQPDRLVLWGGFLPPDTQLDSPRLRGPSLHMVIGSRDRFVNDDRLAAEEQRLASGKLPYRLLRYEGGHGVTRERLTELARRLDGDA